MAARTSPAERSGVFTPGSVVGGKYRVLRRVGEGATAHVWSAEHLITGRRVALKVMKDQAEDVRRRFLREARAACALHHPAVVQVFDAIETDEGDLAIVMELLDGSPLSGRLAEGRMRLAEAANVLVPVLSAVGYAHTLGIVHRDLKPDNIFVTREGRTLVVDFGLAKDLLSNGASMVFTQRNEAVGTPAYMAPEQAFPNGPIDHRADIWSLGLIVYEMLAAELPTMADSLGRVFQRIASARFAPLESRVDGLPPAVSVLVGRMLARERNQRTAEVAEAYDVLARFADPDVVSRYPRPAPARPTPGLVDVPPAELAPASQSSTDAVTLRTPTRRPRSRALAVVGVVVAGLCAVGVTLAVQRAAGTPLATTAMARSGAVTRFAISAEPPPPSPARSSAPAVVLGSALPTSAPAAIPQPPSRPPTSTPRPSATPPAPASAAPTVSPTAAPGATASARGGFW